MRNDDDGEHRNYKRKGAVFDRPAVDSIVTRSGGSGAVQLAARYSTLDLDDGASTRGNGELDDSTDGLVLRFQVDF